MNYPWANTILNTKL